MDQDTDKAAPEPPPQDIVVTGSRPQGSSVSAIDVAKTAVGMATAPASTMRGIARRLYEKSAGDSNELVRSIGDRANDRQGSGKGQSKASKAIDRAGAPAGAVIGGNVAAGIGAVSDIIKSNGKAGDAAAEAGKDIVTGAANGAGPLIGGAVGFMMGAVDSGKTANEMKRGIDELVNRDVPGFEHQTRVINGKTVDVYVSAVDAQGNPSKKPWVYVDDHVGPKTGMGSKGGMTPAPDPRKDPDVARFADDIRDKAVGEVDQHRLDVADDNERRQQQRQKDSDGFEKRYEGLDKLYPQDEDGNFTSKEAEAAYNAEVTKIEAERARRGEATAPRSASGEIKDKMTGAYAEIDTAKKDQAPSPSPQPQLAYTAPAAPSATLVNP